MLHSNLFSDKRRVFIIVGVIFLIVTICVVYNMVNVRVFRFEDKSSQESAECTVTFTRSSDGWNCAVNEVTHPVVLNATGEDQETVDCFLSNQFYVSADDYDWFVDGIDDVGHVDRDCINLVYELETRCDAIE